ncbi:Minor curlin subunit precursor [compost metagenome]
MYFEQNGTDNILVADQHGTANLALGFTYGNDNKVDLEQSGAGNYSYIYQADGGYNEATVKQTDGVNLSSIIQSGSSNQANVTQSNANMNSDILQTGNGNQATVLQQ